MGPVTFSILATLVILAALAVILHPDPVYSALALVVVLCLLAVFFVGLDAHLIAALQVIVYAGAIMVLFLFVVMLLGRPEASEEWTASLPLRLGAGVGAAGLAAAMTSVAVRAGLPSAAALPDGFGTTAVVARELFTTYLFPFELTSVLLLIAVVGAVILARGSASDSRGQRR